MRSDQNVPCLPVMPSTSTVSLPRRIIGSPPCELPSSSPTLEWERVRGGRGCNKHRSAASPLTPTLSPQAGRGRGLRRGSHRAASTAAFTASSIRSNGVMPSRSFTMAIASSSLVPWMVKKMGIAGRAPATH